MFRTVLAHLSGTDCDLSVLGASLALLAGRKGHIQCLRLIPDPAALIAQAAQTDLGGWVILSDTVTEIEREASERTKRAQATLAAFAQKENIRVADDPHSGDGLSISWREETGDDFDAITHAARHHDVVVVAGGSERPGRLPEEGLGGIILGSGRPVLLAPQTAPREAFSNIAIAWRDKPEAARAITAAMPLLEAANRVEVFTVNEAGTDSGEALQSCDAIVHNLRAHDLNANGHLLVSEGRAAAEVVVENALKQGASLLVAGAYGHSRIREFVFGGFTQRILKGADLPVLMFH